MPADEVVDFLQENSPRKYLKREQILQRFQLDDVRLPNRYNNSYFNYIGTTDVIEIRGYDYLSPSIQFNLNPKNTSGQSAQIGKYEIKAETGSIVVYNDKVALSRFDAYDWLMDRETKDENQLILEPKRVLYTEGGVEIAMHILNASVSKNGDEFSYSNMQVFLLYRGTNPVVAKPNP